MIFHNLSINDLYKHAQQMYGITNTEALCAYSGTYTGRCPHDKRISYNNDTTRKQVWWGNVNIDLSQEIMDECYKKGMNHILKKNNIYVMDSYAGWDNREGGMRINIRTICSDPYHALFIKNMLIPSEKKHNSKEINLTILNCGDITTRDIGTYNKGGVNENLIGLNLDKGQVVIYGTKYAGEMKKAVLTYVMHVMPNYNHLPLHSSACINSNGDTLMFFGLSGTGKTTLSATEGLQLIGDDEHVWTQKGIFNVEGGCYAKCVGLTEKREPEIFSSIKRGAVLENVVLDDKNIPNFLDTSITYNTRCAYPLNHLSNVKIPAYIDTHPKNIIFLVCDAYGIFPAISKLTIQQARFYFMLGYTCKIVGTEQGVSHPEKTFSSCFAEPFITHHPEIYGDLLEEKIKKHYTNVWLLNTGWLKNGNRMDLNTTRSIVNMISNGFNMGEFKQHKQFHFSVPISLPNVETNYLQPELNWNSVDEYEKEANNMYEEFCLEFENKFGTK